MQSPDSSFLSRAYALSSPSEARNLYDEWAGTYDAELNAAQYTGPSFAVDAIVEQLKWSSRPAGTSLKVLDAGCGSGLVGTLLVPAVKKLELGIDLDGVDISPGMLKSAAEKKVYSSLKEADLSKPIDAPDNIYDIVVCVGTLTQGHVGPAVINEFARVAKKDAMIVLTVHQGIWVSGGYQETVQQLQTSGQAEVLRDEAIGYTRNVKEGGRLLVLKRFRA